LNYGNIALVLIAVGAAAFVYFAYYWWEVRDHDEHR
jgi:hypothetical protein